ncbi:hypothetical protein [Nocardia lasii]|uniref:hypothetical protein n=1 Tax=Nocardia lasii TaxID=1616107 RepID=UPI00366A7976
MLCVLGAAQETVADRLVEWERLDSLGAVRALRDLVLDGCRVREGRVLPTNSYWERDRITYREVVDWLNDGPALAAVTAAFDRADEPELLELLAETYSALDLR